MQQAGQEHMALQLSAALSAACRIALQLWLHWGADMMASAEDQLMLAGAHSQGNVQDHAADGARAAQAPECAMRRHELGSGCGCVPLS